MGEDGHARSHAASTAHELAWWANAVTYQIYPRSFADGDGDGIGDLAGLVDRLDHLAWLGVDAVWLSPIYPSPMADFGYDVSDYCDVDPVFGNLDDVDRLVAEAHRRDLRVLLDWVPNHTSIQHRWFVDSASSRSSERRDWYVWRDSAPDGGPPNNWCRMWSTEPAWTFHESTGQWFLHCYFPEQPDLNWLHPDVEAAMHDTLRFWLDRGIDGFRADVVHLIGKGPDLPDLVGEAAQRPITRQISTEYGHELLRRIRTLLDGHERQPMMIGEVVLFDPGQVATYYGDGDELHQVFNFRPIKTPWTAPEVRSRIAEVHDEIGDRFWPTWVLGNHDNPRQRTRFGTDARVRAAAVLTLTLRGNAYLYAGEELGLADAEIDPADWLDPAGRDGCRTPMPWSIDDGHGWPTTPWLPFVPDAAERSVEHQQADRSSTLWLYRDLLSLRSEHPALQEGAEELLDGDDDVVSWRRSTPGERLEIHVNLAPGPRRVSTGGRILLSSDPHRQARIREGAVHLDAALGADEAVVVDIGDRDATA